MTDPQMDESGEGSLLGVFLAIPVALIALVIFAWSLTGSSGESTKFNESSACVQPFADNVCSNRVVLGGKSRL